MSKPALHGVCPVVATPFSETGAIDFESLRNEIEALAAGGNHAIVLFGVVSEFFKLSDTERRQVAEVVSKTAQQCELPLVISVTHDATEIAVDWAQEYEELGADALMIYPPSWLDPGPRAVCRHLTTVAEAVSLPVMVQYRQPDNPVIPPHMLAELSRDVENIEYFKIETANTGAYVSSLLNECDAEVLVGRAGYQMIDIFDRGGVGVIPAASFHELYVAIYDAYESGDRERAIELHNRLLPALNIISEASIPLEKRVLSMRDIIDSPYCRQPMHVEPDDSHIAQLEEHYEDVVGLIARLSSPD